MKNSSPASRRTSGGAFEIASLAGGSTANTASTASTATTIRRQEADQVVHRGEVGAVDSRGALPLTSDQSGTLQFLQMEGESRGRDLEDGPDRAGRKALGTGLNQGSKHIEAGFLSEGGQRADHVSVIHISNAVEI